MKYITFIIVILFLVQIVSFSAVIPTEVAPVSQDNRLSARGLPSSSGKIQLISETSQGITIQLTISKSDFVIDTKERNGKQFQTLSFQGCRYTTEPGIPPPSYANRANWSSRRREFYSENS